MLKWLANLFGFRTKSEYNELADKYIQLQKENIDLFTNLKEQENMYNALLKEVQELKEKIAEFEKDKLSVTLISDNEIDTILK
jgi:predicted nuclease with TOPRIM domain